jgi:SPP1 family predicted phage head-tail adaptor
MIDPGRLNRRIRLQVAEYSKNSTGEQVATWVDSPEPSTVWAMVNTTRGSEQYQAERKTASRMKDFLIRYRTDADETWTVLYQDRRYDIRAVEEVGTREGLVLKGEWTQGKYDE